jgi:hypothetical protein
MWFDDALQSARLLREALAAFAAFVPPAVRVLTGSMVPLYTL